MVLSREDAKKMAKGIPSLLDRLYVEDDGKMYHYATEQYVFYFLVEV